MQSAAEDGTDVRILPGADDDVAARAISALACGAERHATGNVDRTARREVGAVAEDGNRTAVREQRKSFRRWQNRPVIDDEADGAQRRGRTEREMTARGIDRRGLQIIWVQRGNGQRREIEDAETQGPGRRADAPLDVEIRGGEGDRATGGGRERDARRHRDIAVAVIDPQCAEPARRHEFGRQDHLTDAIGTQRRGITRGIQRERIRLGEAALRLEDDAWRCRRMRQVVERVGIVLLESQRQRAEIRFDRALPRTRDGVSAQCAIERHRGRGNGNPAAGSTVGIALLEMRSVVQQRDGEGFRDAPLHVLIDGHPRIQPVVNPIRCGLRNVEHMAAGDDLRGLDDSPLIVDPPARHVDRRAGLEHDRTARIQLHRATRGREFADRSLD